jgi:colanic acid/amylovoran biosynthesis glycosyltransferase
MSRVIGYLIPEFPGQTHAFVWREYAVLQGLQVRPVLISTRRPLAATISHDWSKEAMQQTRYLMPPALLTALGALLELGRTRPRHWRAYAASLRRMPDVSARRLPRYLLLAWAGAELAYLARRNGFSHVHVHSCADAAHVALFAHLLFGLEYSIMLHGPLRDYGPNQREKWARARFAIVITKRLLEEVREELAGVLPARVEIAPMGVDTDRFVRGRPYRPWNREGPLQLFSCARLNFCKGHETLLEATQLLRQRGLDVRVTIAGEDEEGGSGYRKVLEQKRDALGLGTAAMLIGAVNETRVRDELERAHVFVLASLAEPLGVAIMEAMAMALPVVATETGGVPELVDTGIDGLLIPPLRPDLLAAAIERIARDPALATNLASRAREKIVQSFGSERSASLLHRLLDADRSAVPPPTA